MSDQGRENRRFSPPAGGRLAVSAAAAGLLVLVTGCAGVHSAGPAADTTTLGGHSPAAAAGHPPSGYGASEGGGLAVSVRPAARPKASSRPAGRLVRPPMRRPATVRQLSGVAGGALFGGNAGLVNAQPQLHRKLAIVRVYYKYGQMFPWGSHRQLMAAGSTLLVSVDTVPPGPTYNSIAAGRHDAYFGRFLRAVNSAAVQYHLGSIYISFEHEVNFPNHHKGLGTPAAFVRAWDHIHHLAVAAHLDWQQGGRLHWVLILSHRTYTDQVPVYAGGPAKEYWPGNNEVDVVGADGYDSFGCKPKTWKHATTPRNVFGPVVTWAAAHGNLPIFIAEWADCNAIPTAQLTYVQQMQAFAARHSSIAAALYWDSPGRRGCSYRLSGASLAAIAAMGHSAAMQGRVVQG